jgi:hypothetical protein
LVINEKKANAPSWIIKKVTGMAGHFYYRMAKVYTEKNKKNRVTIEGVLSTQIP